MNRPSRREDYNFIKKKVEYTFYDPATASKELVDEVFAIVNDKGKLIRILSLAKSAIRHNMSDELHTLKQPTCLIWGKQDSTVTIDHAEGVRKAIPQAQYHPIERAGHLPHMERGDVVNPLLIAFLRAAPRSDTAAVTVPSAR